MLGAREEAKRGTGGGRFGRVKMLIATLEALPGRILEHGIMECGLEHRKGRTASTNH